MIVSYETLPLKPLEAGSNVAEEWREVINRSVPAFLIDASGATLDEAAAKYVTPYVEELGLVVSTYHIALGTHRGSDKPLHADGLESVDRSGLTVMHAHHTKEGENEASLFEHVRAGNPPSPRVYKGRPTTDRELFKLGLVEDQVLKPTRYLATLTPGSLLVFRPSLPHTFKSTKVPRSSNVLVVAHQTDVSANVS